MITHTCRLIHTPDTSDASDKLAILNASMDFMEHKQEICQRMRNLRVDTETGKGKGRRREIKSKTSQPTQRAKASGEEERQAGRRRQDGVKLNGSAFPAKTIFIWSFQFQSEENGQHTAESCLCVSVCGRHETIKH